MLAGKEIAMSLATLHRQPLKHPSSHMDASSMPTSKPSKLSRVLLRAVALLVLLAMLILLAGPATSQVAHAGGLIYIVPGGAGAQDGSSWANAKDLTAALTTATSGDDLWVKAGTYTPSTGGDRTASFTLKSGVAVYGGFAGTETQRDERNWHTNITILSGDLNGDDGANFANNGENSYHVVQGGGANNTAILDGFTIAGGNANGTAPNNGGGGMYNPGSSPTLANLIFISNSAPLGGGMYNNSNSNPTLTNVTFSGNRAPSGSGGGMYNRFGSNPTLTNVVFSGNSAFAGGGMINFSESSPTLTNVTFSGNFANGQGGAMYNYVSSNPTIRNSIFWDNAGMNPEIYDRDDGSSPLSIASVSSSIVAGSGGSGSSWWSANKVIDGGHNLAANPLFVTAVPTPAPSLGGDLHLQTGSPAVDTGSNAYVAGVTTDLDGNLRIMGDTVDMGAYELGGQPDMLPPTASPMQSPAADGSGWNNSDVTVTWNWSDGSGSGIDPDNCTTSSTSSGEGAIILTAQCKDLQGNRGSASYSIKVDKTAPSISIVAPASTSYLLNQVVATTFSCSDGLSGVVSCVGSTANGANIDTASIGAKTFSVMATDNVANQSSQVVMYTIRYGFGGLQAPYAPPTQRSYRAGSVIPLMWQYTDASGVATNSAAAAPAVQISGSTSCVTTDGDAITVLAAGASGLQYDVTTNTWQFNWQTHGLAAGCYSISIVSGQSGQTNGPFPIMVR